MTRYDAAPRRRRNRGGTTLVEVLMSLLIMGIGVAAVAALFPVSMLKSVRATQQTTATALRYSVEGMLDASGLDPDFENGRPGCATAAFALDPDGDQDPERITIGVARPYTPEKYVVDPLGYWRLRQQSSAPLTAHPATSEFGSWPAIDAGRADFIPRFGAFKHLHPDYDPAAMIGDPGDPLGNPASLTLADWATLAEGFVGAPDQATTVADGFATYAAGPPATVQFAAGDADFTPFAASGLDLLRVTVFSADNRRSAVVGVSGADLPNRRLELSQPLPSWAATLGTGRVLVEARETRYSWLLTIRNQPYNGGRLAYIDVAVCFRRPFGPEHEQIYLVGREQPDSVEDAGRRSDAREYFVTWDSTDPGTQPPPDVTGGRWVFDPPNFRWFKIGGVEAERPDPDIPGNTRITFRLEGNEPDGETFNRGMFLPGVVDVFPLVKQVHPLTDQ